MPAHIDPLDTRVLILVGSPTEEDDSGIVIPESAKDDYPAEGVVIRFGAEVTDLKEGERVLFSKYAGDDVQVAGLNYKIVPRENVLGKIIHD